MNPLLHLIEHGQSYWLDNLTRDMIQNGELERRVRQEGLRGLTSNPSIFHKAITGGTAYDEQIRSSAKEGLGAREIYERLVIADIQSACDILKPVYDDSEGVDGFVSLEVSPYLVHDTTATMEEARRLFKEVDRPNVLIKIPGSPEGVPAIEQMLFEGINVNITLLFSIEAYEAVAEAYLSAMERRAEEGQPLDTVASVASFFLSRIDVLVDQLLGQRIRPGSADGVPNPTAQLMGKAAVANAKLAYQSFKRLFDGDRWVRLATRGARRQRVLWASTSTKNPLYSDVRYVEPLIGPYTVNTLPDRTIEAFADHGRIQEGSLEEGLLQAQAVMDTLADLDIDFDSVTWQLLNEGMEKFTTPYDKLLETLQEKRQGVLGAASRGQEVSGLELSGALEGLDETRFGERLHAHDPWLWAGTSSVAEVIANRLGWLEAVDGFTQRVDEIDSLAQEVKSGGVARVVLLGMGGSSLCPDASRAVFGSAEGFPELLVLDSTDPRAVLAATEGVDENRVLFVVSSKSGSTAETLAFFRHFFRDAQAAFGESAGNRFVAITDPGSPLAGLAEKHGFQKVFANPQDVGGRYSALTYFGLVPMALQGIDVERVLARARTQLTSCSGALPSESNPGVHLGATLGLAANTGRNKITFVMPERLAPFGWWLEHLLAESTGKEGKGLLPVVDEPAMDPSVYGDDRVFVSYGLNEAPDRSQDQRLEALERAGHPVVRLKMEDVYDLGAEFVRWEVATATAGAILGVNPFDEPDVSMSKENTRAILQKWTDSGHASEPHPDMEAHGLRAWLGPIIPSEGAVGAGDPSTPLEAVRNLVESLGPGDYLAILPYLARTPERDEFFRRFRKAVGTERGIATSLGYGPRYLHSTGQLHKGGPSSGAFLILTITPEEEVPIPEEKYGFGTLLQAKALGDFQALKDRGRRVLRLHLGARPDEKLEALLEGLVPARP